MYVSFHVVLSLLSHCGICLYDEVEETNYNDSNHYNWTILNHCRDLCMMVQCIPSHQRCDNVENCINRVDEQLCPRMKGEKWIAFSPTSYITIPPILVDFNESGIHISNFTTAGSKSCPFTHFKCPGDLICLPVYMRCNHVYDCPGHEDEAECGRYSVPGFYRCRASLIHLHLSHMCDRLFQCPQMDDELFCNWTCPLNCTCYGSAFFCTSSFSVQQYIELRFVEGRGSGLKPVDFVSNTMLVYLGLASCGVTQLILPRLHNLRCLDLSDNYLHAVNGKDLLVLEELKALSLSGNPLNLQSLSPHRPVYSLTVLDLSKLHIPLFNVDISATFPNVQRFNLSNTGTKVSPYAFQKLRNLHVLDIRGCHLNQFHRNVFSGLQQLEVVYSDNYKLCCSASLPRDFNVKNCHAPSDMVSSCHALLRTNTYRVLLALFSASSLLGNLLSFAYHVQRRDSGSCGFLIFVVHLCVSDFLMGVYLAIIGVADGVYRGLYLWKDEDWRHSALCQAAGVLSFLSREVSAFMIFLITLDRFLVLQFPFSQCHFSHRSASVVCGIVWCGGLMLAMIPLMPSLSHWQYYSQSGICIPLPVPRTNFASHMYTFGIMNIFYSILMSLVALAQLIIYYHIRANTLCEYNASTYSRSKDLTIARRLLTVAMSDFLCWFSIGLLGLLDSLGVAVPNEVKVAMAIIVLPLNSVLNPFLYTVNLIQERGRKAKELRLQKRLMVQGRQQAGREFSAAGVTDILKLTYTKEEVCFLLERWLQDRLVSKEQLHELLNG